jgi:hypothetical protein
MSRFLICGPLFGIVLASQGCARPERRMHDVRPVSEMEVEASQADRLWAAAEQTLRAKRYPIDRLDRRNGVITTLPELSQHWFEFWRHDVATSRDWAEASLNAMRRWVHVSLSPMPVEAAEGTERSESPPTSIRLEVMVHLERLSVPDRQFNSSGAAFQAFGSSLPATTGAVRVTPKEEQWIPLKEDSAMANRLLAAIAERYESTLLPR